MKFLDSRPVSGYRATFFRANDGYANFSSRERERIFAAQI